MSEKVVMGTKYRIDSRSLGTFNVFVPFMCLKCGNCCRNVQDIWGFTQIHKVSKYLGITAEDFINKYIGKVQGKENGKIIYILIPSKYQPCPFLSPDNVCSIYAIRPEGCRLYPVGTDFGATEEQCPGWKRYRFVCDHLIRGYRIWVGFHVDNYDCWKDQYDETKLKLDFKPNKKQWNHIFAKYLKTEPSAEERALFEQQRRY